MKTAESILGAGQDTLLDLKLDELRNELAKTPAPAAMEGALIARFRATRPAIARPRLWWMPPLALAATIAIASWIIRGPVPGDQGIVSLAPNSVSYTHLTLPTIYSV